MVNITYNIDIGNTTAYLYEAPKARINSRYYTYPLHLTSYHHCYLLLF